MRYLRIYAEDDGTSHFQDVELQGTLTEVIRGIPPLLVSGPFKCSGIAFVDRPVDALTWNTHVAPRRQWIIVVSGRLAITASDGERRDLGPGSVILAEDTTGRGHLSIPLTPDFGCAMIPSSE
jgi:quercetin dioxygenase-like cupin family protein